MKSWITAVILRLLSKQIIVATKPATTEKLYFTNTQAPSRNGLYMAMFCFFFVYEKKKNSIFFLPTRSLDATDEKKIKKNNKKMPENEAASEEEAKTEKHKKQ